MTIATTLTSGDLQGMQTGFYKVCRDKVIDAVYNSTIIGEYIPFRMCINSLY